MATRSSTPAIENSMDRGVQWATVHGFKKSWTELSTTYMKSVQQKIWQRLFFLRIQLDLQSDSVDISAIDSFYKFNL